MLIFEEIKQHGIKNLIIIIVIIVDHIFHHYSSRNSINYNDSSSRKCNINYKTDSKTINNNKNQQMLLLITVITLQVWV